MVVVTFSVADRAPTLMGVKRRFHLHSGEVDEDFGVRLIHSGKSVYAIRVSPDAVKRVTHTDPHATANADLRIGVLG
jgi:hypothetical protein